MFTDKQLENVKVEGFKFLKRAKIFKGNRGNCSFDPLTGYAHSYEWYTLAKRMNGVQVVNTYSYSNQTVKHRNKVIDVLSQLDVDFIGIQAPSGLGNLEDAFTHIVSEYGKAVVELKYARIKSTHGVVFALKQIENLKQVAPQYTKRFTKKVLETAVDNAEKSRRQKLDYAKAKRLRTKQASKPQVMAQVADVTLGV